jgi:RNase P protein component
MAARGRSAFADVGHRVTKKDQIRKKFVRSYIRRICREFVLKAVFPPLRTSWVCVVLG